MATTIGVVVAEPAYETDGYTVQAITQGIAHDLAGGALAVDVAALRYRFTLRWKMLTAAERNTLRARAEVFTAQAFTTPDGDAYTVFVVPSSWKENYVEAGDGTKYYNCELQLEESA